MIDVHVHIFPDGIAAQAVDKLAREAGITPFSDGRLSSLQRQMEQGRVSRAFNQPVATSPAQVRGINRKMIELNAKGLSVHSFAAMHPDHAGAAEEIHFLAENGVRGIKLHPEYQAFYPDDDRMLPLYEACAAGGLVILFHAGRDLAFPDVHGTPARFRQVAAVRGLKIVLAHMGGYQMWDEAEKYLAGLPVWFDTSFCTGMEDACLAALIAAHGSDRVLFGTDSPWENAGRTAAKIRGLGLGREAEERIFSGNAAMLFGD